MTDDFVLGQCTSVNTQLSCVDTTEYLLMSLCWDIALVSTHSSHIFVLVVSTLDQVRSTLDLVSSRSVCLTGKQVDTRSKQVDTRPSFQQISLPDWESRSTLDQVRSTLDQSRSTLDQVRSTLDPVSSRSVCLTGTTGQHTLAESQKREFLWTRGCLGFRGFDLGFRAHAPQDTLWTYEAINAHVPCTPKAREPIHFQKKPFGGQRGFSRFVSISRSYKPSFQEEGQGNQGESLERSLLCKAREQIQLKRCRRRRISGISDAIKAEHRQLRRISIDFYQGSSIEAFTHFCLGSVDTRSSQVDTRSSQVDTRSKQVDTRSSQVDTRPSFQQISLPDWDNRSTLDQVRSTHFD
ncbi:hypothetical protein Taro_022587 [Colocasia esculenta]|uniref:Uncharacterized protein n=1 Tax=Colocasia esculenta TaxID=4460 RepID=A0A843VEX1_COLES|nr:hypothetical protein [Colocasia esculenta]